MLCEAIEYLMVQIIFLPLGCEITVLPLDNVKYVGNIFMNKQVLIHK